MPAPNLEVSISCRAYAISVAPGPRTEPPFSVGVGHRILMCATPSTSFPAFRPALVRATDVGGLRVTHRRYHRVTGTQRTLSSMRFLYRGLPFPLVFLWLSAHVSGTTKGRCRNRHGLHGRRFEGWQKVWFDIRRCGCNLDRAAYSFRRRRQKRGTEYAAVEHRGAGNHRFAEPVKLSTCVGQKPQRSF